MMGFGADFCNKKNKDVQLTSACHISAMTASLSSRRAETVTISGINPGKFTLSVYSESSTSSDAPSRRFRWPDVDARIIGRGVPGGGDLR